MSPIYINKEQTKSAADLATIAECDDALVWLHSQVAGIEAAGLTTHAARLALKMRKLGIERVEERRADLRRSQNILEVAA